MIRYSESINGSGRVGVGAGRAERQRKGGIVSSQVDRGRSYRARWLVASLSALALVTLSACSGDDDDDNAESASGTGSASEDSVLVTAQSDEGPSQADLDAANAKIADQEQQITDLNAQLDTANAATADAQAQADSEKTRADQAESDLAALQTQVDDFKAEFPVTITASLEPFTNDLVGGYTMTLTEAYCAALPTCGQPRQPVHADIIQGPNGLQLQIPNVFTTGLFMVEGSLFGVTASNQLAYPCTDGTPTNAQVSITIFASGIDVAVDGTESLEGLGASVIVSAAPAGTCGPGTIFFSSTLTPD